MSEAFWSLDNDLQLGYEIRDHTYEINSILLAISSAASRSNIVQSDDKTKKALASLNVLSSNLRGSPVSFYTEIGYAAASRVNSEVWHLNRIKDSHSSYDSTLKSLTESNLLVGLSDVVHPVIFLSILENLKSLQNLSDITYTSAQNVTLDIARLRANGTTTNLTPESISKAISSNAEWNIVNSLISTREILRDIQSSVEDVTSTVGIHGSIHEILSRSSNRDLTSRSTALQNFVNNFNRVRNNLLSSIANYRQNAETGIYNFIRRVQSTYDDGLVRTTFDQKQLPVVVSFAKVISTRVFNETFFESEFDKMKDSIVESYIKIVNGTLNDGSEFRDKILELQRLVFVRKYSSCMDELVTEAQQSSSSLSSRYTFCLSERTSGIVVVIPSASIWLGSIRDSINTALQQLNLCFNGQTSADGRAATSNCFQYVSLFVHTSSTLQTVFLFTLECQQFAVLR